jgi:hypothetical protein
MRLLAHLRVVGLQLGLVAALGAGACASEGTEVFDHELAGLAARSEAGVAQISIALATPDAASRQLGEGVQLVDDATRALGRLESDPRASDAQRVQAVLLQARAWDDTARAILAAARPDAGAAALETLSKVLAEKAFPAQVAAHSAYERALALVCELGLDPHPAVLEMIDGVERYGGTPPPADAPCGP